MKRATAIGIAQCLLGVIVAVILSAVIYELGKLEGRREVQRMVRTVCAI